MAAEPLPQRTPPPALPCGDTEWSNRHCANMACHRYINKCDLHGLSPTGDHCNLQVDAVPVCIGSFLDRVTDVSNQEGVNNNDQVRIDIDGTLYHIAQIYLAYDHEGQFIVIKAGPELP